MKLVSMFGILWGGFMKWESLGPNRLSHLHVMSGERIKQKLNIFRIKKFFWFLFVFTIVLTMLSYSGKQFLINSNGRYLQSESVFQYPQFVRTKKIAVWKLKIKNSRKIWMSETLKEKIKIVEVIPGPKEVAEVDKKLFIVFKEPPEVIFLKVQPVARGFVEGSIGGEREVFSVAFLAFP
jgi:hypothetical protein